MTTPALRWDHEHPLGHERGLCRICMAELLTFFVTEEMMESDGCSWVWCWSARIHGNHLADFLDTTLNPSSRVSDSVALGWDLRICPSNKFPGWNLRTTSESTWVEGNSRGGRVARLKGETGTDQKQFSPEESSQLDNSFTGPSSWKAPRDQRPGSVPALP